jgi:hypothetical protein
VVGVALPVHRPTLAVAVGLDPFTALAAGNHSLEQPLGTYHHPGDGLSLFPGLHPLVKVLSDNSLMLAWVLLFVVAHLPQIEPAVERVFDGWAVKIPPLRVLKPWLLSQLAMVLVD